MLRNHAIPTSQIGDCEDIATPSVIREAPRSKGNARRESRQEQRKQGRAIIRALRRRQQLRTSSEEIQVPLRCAVPTCTDIRECGNSLGVWRLPQALISEDVHEPYVNPSSRSLFEFAGTELHLQLVDFASFVLCLDVLERVLHQRVPGISHVYHFSLPRS